MQEGHTWEFALSQVDRFLRGEYKLSDFSFFLIEAVDNFLIGLFQHVDNFVVDFILKVNNLSLSRNRKTIGCDICLDLLWRNFDLLFFGFFDLVQEIFCFVLFFTRQPYVLVFGLV
jgi:hypothetical protein